MLLKRTKCDGKRQKNREFIVSFKMLKMYFISHFVSDGVPNVSGGVFDVSGRVS